MPEAKITKESCGESPMPWWIILFPIGYIIVLVALVVLWSTVRTALPLSLLHPYYSMSLSVLWFGSLGGVVIALQGIYAHNKSWDSKYKYWYMTSGIVGAIYGLFGYLFLVVIDKATTKAGNSILPDVYAIVAFTLGYAQQQFHALIKEVISVFLSPGHKTSSGPKPDDATPNQSNTNP